MQKLLITSIFFSLWLTGLGQVQVTVVDKSTGDAIPGVALYVRNEGSEEKIAVGTSNEQGRIDISIDKFPCTLVTSHIGYAEKEIKITTTE